MGLEGIIGKRADSTYTGRRSPEWVKLKCQRRQEFVIGGWTDPRGSGRHFGALHVGVYEDGKLRHVTRVGSGFDDAFQDKLWPELQALARKDSPFGDTGPSTRADHWVEPRLVCEVRFTEWTADGGVRHPIFMGMRTDKTPEEVRREDPHTPVEGPAVESEAPEAGEEAAGPPSPSARTGSRAPEERIVRLSNLK